MNQAILRAVEEDREGAGLEAQRFDKEQQTIFTCARAGG
jgi:hypothetical protein